MIKFWFPAKKRNLIFFSLLVLGGIGLYALPAQAFLDVPFAAAQMALDALDFVDSLITKLIVGVILASVGGAMFITVAAKLLDWTSGLSVGLSDNALVEAGWGFTSGLVNIVFILILVVIALAYIFKWETFGMKKALPRLIIIALLVNFSLLFVKMFVDIGWIVQNSFKNELGGDLASSVINQMRIVDNLKLIISRYGAILAAYKLLALVPFANVAQLLLIAGLVVSDPFFNTISQALLFIIFAFAGGFIFFVYAILFFLRIAIIWLLAIAAPLALVALILPATGKYFHQWLRYLVQWVFLGVVVFFLMGLGLRLFNLVAPSGGGFSVDVFTGGWNFAEQYSRFIFLIVYLAIVYSLSKKFMPTGMNFVWDLGGKMVLGGSAFAAGWVARRGWKAKAWSAEKTAGLSRRVTRKEEAGLPLTRGERAGRWWVRRMGGPELVEAQEIEAKRRLIFQQRRQLAAKTRDMDEEGAKATLRAELEKHKRAPLRDKAKTAALYELLAEKDALKDADMSLYGEAWKASGPEDVSKNPLKKAILSRMRHWGTYNERKKLLETMNPADIDRLNRAAKENETVIKEIVSTWRSDFINRLGSQSKAVREKVQKEIDNTLGAVWKKWEKDPDIGAGLDSEGKKRLMRQLEVLRGFHTSPASQILGWKKYGKDADEIKAKIDELRKKMKT